ncbi:MAG: FHA domain-containing protein [Planctomycetota bacterium]
MSSNILVRDGGRQTIVEIGTDPITIGRDPSSRIVIEDRLASRNHGRFFWDGSAFVYEDLGSSNGSLLSGEKVKRITLGDGDSIHIGEAVLRVELPGTVGAGDSTPLASVDSESSVDTGDEESIEPEGPRLLMTGIGKDRWVSVFPRMVIGRSPESDVTIDDAKVSSRHASIVEKNGRWFVLDMDSGNGIVVGDRKAKKLELKDGYSFRIGPAAFSIHGFGPKASSGDRAGKVASLKSTAAKTASASSPELVVSRSSNVEIGGDSPQGFATLVFIGILALVFYSGYGFFKDLTANPDLVVVEGDRLAGEGFFEFRPTGPLQDSVWEIVSGNGSVQIVQGDDAPQGSQWMDCQGEPGLDGVFRVQFQDLFEVKAGQGLSISGRVANAGFDRVGLSVRWFERGDSGDVVTSESFTSLRSHGSWAVAAAEIPVPVEGSGGSARICVVGLGDNPGTVRCDQLLVRTIDSDLIPPANITAGDAGQEISLEVDHRGVAQLSRGRTELVADFRIALGAPRPMPWGQLLPSRKEQIVVGEDGSLRLGFEIHEVGEKAVVQQFARSIGWRIASTWSPQRPIPMVLVGKIPFRRIKEPVQVFSGNDSGVYHEQLSQLTACRGTEISLGKGNSQVVISFLQPVEFSVLPEPAGRGLLLLADAGLVPAGGAVDVSISASSEREQARVQAAHLQIQSALEQRQEGLAVELMKNAREAFPWREDLASKIESLEVGLQVEIKAAIDQIKAVQADIDRYPGSPAGKYLEKICQRALERFVGLEPERLAKEILASRDESAMNAQNLLSEGRIEQVLAHARESMGKNHLQIARFYFEWVIQHHPTTPGAEEAQQGLKLLEARGS